MSRPSALIPNSYQTPNLIVDKLLRHLSCPQAKVLMVICRQTFGWHKHEDTISLSRFESLAGISRSSANKALRELEESTLVIKTSGKGPRLMNAWSFNLSAARVGGIHPCHKEQRQGPEADERLELQPER